MPATKLTIFGRVPRHLFSTEISYARQVFIVTPPFKIFSIGDGVVYPITRHQLDLIDDGTRSADDDNSSEIDLNSERQPLAQTPHV